MKIGDRVFIRGYIDEIRKDTVIVRNDGGYFGTVPSEVITGELPSAQPEYTDAEGEPIVRDMAPSAEEEPCEDAVGREAVSEWLKQYGQDVLHGKYKLSLMYIWKNLTDLPSVQIKRKNGKWIYNSPVTMKCNQCGFVIKDWDWHRFKFCPNCDCDMRGEQE